MYTSKLSSGKQINLILLRNVKNMADVKQKVIAGDLNCCIIKPSYIIHPFQIEVAAEKAVMNEVYGTMVTKSVNTEILFNLSLSKKITQALTKFGVENTDSEVLVCVINESIENTEGILSHFDGEQLPIDQLNTLSQESLIKKEYKISGIENSVATMLQSVVSRIAAKDFISLS